MTLDNPAAISSQESAAPQVTGQNTSEELKTPQAETPAGSPQATEPAGEGQAASDRNDDLSQEDGKKTWKEKRQERNRERWRDFQEAKAYRDRRMEALEQENARLRSMSPPDFSQFTDPQEELAERTAWKIQQRQAQETDARHRAEAEATQATVNHAMRNAWLEHVEDGRARIPDFDAVVDRAPIHKNQAPFIIDSEKGADIAYFLGQPENQATARRLFGLFASNSPQALIELGKIEARISAPTPKTVSTAPRPAPVLSGGSNPLAFDATRADVAAMQAHLKKAGTLR